MTTMFRALAITIALAAVVDPVVARRAAVPLAVDVFLPSASDPEYPRAVAIRDQIAAALDTRATINGAETPQAVVAIGRATLRAPGRAPLFSMPLPAVPSVSIRALRAPPVVPGQRVPVVAVLRATGLSGRTTSIAIERVGGILETIDHVWTSDDEGFAARFELAPAGAGVHRVRVTAATPGLEPSTAADLAIVTRDRRLRVLAYEPRPSWPLAFVRRSLEADPLFEVSGTVRTTGRSATISGGAPSSLAALQPDRFDAILVGAPEALSDADIRTLEAFVSRRGGALIVLPDRPLTDPLRRRFGLPAFDEVVLDTPLTTPAPGPSLRASELLLAPHEARGFEPLSLVRHGNRDRALVLSVHSGAGRIVVSGALDAWRYRADPASSFETFWRALIADAAAAAPSRLSVAAEPSIARPGDEIRITVTVRPTEFTLTRGAVEIPAVRARLLSSAGGEEEIRLWPSATPGAFTAVIRAPRPGPYSVSASSADASADTPLLIADDAVQALPEASRAAAFAAVASGGAVVSGLDDLVQRLGAIDDVDVERRTRPMRAPWWILPFTGALCAEWALRRRSGRR